MRVQRRCSRPSTCRSALSSARSLRYVPPCNGSTSMAHSAPDIHLRRPRLKNCVFVSHFSQAVVDLGLPQSGSMSPPSFVLEALPVHAHSFTLAAGHDPSLPGPHLQARQAEALLRDMLEREGRGSYYVEAAWWVFCRMDDNRIPRGRQGVGKARGGLCYAETC